MGTLHQFKNKQQIEDELAEKEYYEFINLLQFFMENQTPKHKLLRVMIKDNEFIFYDKNNSEVDKPIAFNDFDCQNALISALINLVPEKIEIIQCDDDKILKSIKDIFINRVVVV